VNSKENIFWEILILESFGGVLDAVFVENQLSHVLTMQVILPRKSRCKSGLQNSCDIILVTDLWLQIFSSGFGNAQSCKKEFC
jgi:hypothetical protein